MKLARGERLVKGISSSNYNKEGFQERSNYSIIYTTNSNNNFPLLNTRVIIREGY